MSSLFWCKILLKSMHNVFVICVFRELSEDPLHVQCIPPEMEKPISPETILDSCDTQSSVGWQDISVFSELKGIWRSKTFNFFFKETQF